MENRKCQLQTWKVEKYSGNLCAARTGRGVLGRSRRLAAEMPFPRQGGIAGDSRRRGMPPPGGGGKRGQGHRMVPLPPLDSPKPSFAPRLPSVARRNGSYEGSVPCVGQIWGRCYALNLLCVICSAVSARPDSAGRLICAAKSSASIKCCILKHQTPLWTPAFRRVAEPLAYHADRYTCFQCPRSESMPKLMKRKRLINFRLAQNKET